MGIYIRAKQLVKLAKIQRELRKVGIDTKLVRGKNEYYLEFPYHDGENVQNQHDRRDPTVSTRHFVARSLRDVGYTSFGHDFQELGVAASSGVLDPVLKINGSFTPS